MKLGCCVNMFSDQADPIGRKYLPMLKELKYDFVELPLAQVMDLSNQDFQGLINELHHLSLPCKCCNNFFPAFLRLTGENVAPSGVIDAYLEKALYRAAAMGADKVIFGSSGAKNIPSGYSYDKAYGQIVLLLKRAADIAGQMGITIGLEPLNRKEGNLIRNLSESSQLMKDVASLQVRLMMDYYHFSMECETLEMLGYLVEDIIHVHLADPHGRGFPLAEDLEILSFMKKRGYEGGVSIEAYSRNPCCDLAVARTMLIESFAA